MPNSAIHYLVGALTARTTGLTKHDQAWVALFAIAPDLDVITAIPWLFLAPHLPLPAEALKLGAWLFEHRGFSHTFLAALLCGLAVWRWKRDARWGLAAGLVWASHVLADAITPWPVHPFWPVSDLTVQRPLITTLDPLLSITALVASLAILAPVLAPKMPWPSQDRRRGWARWGRRWSEPATAVAVAAGLVTLSVLPIVATTHGAALASIQPGGFPATVQVEETLEGWTITQRTFPWDEGETSFTPRFDPAPNGTYLSGLYASTLCALPGLGPYGLLEDGALRHEQVNGSTLDRVTLFDPVRNATGEGGPALAFIFQDARLVGVELTSAPGEEDRGFPALGIPQAVVEDAACP